MTELMLLYSLLGGGCRRRRSLLWRNILEKASQGSDVDLPKVRPGYLTCDRGKVVDYTNAIGHDKRAFSELNLMYPCIRLR